MKVYPVIAFIFSLVFAEGAIAQSYSVVNTIQDGNLTIYLIASDQPRITRQYLTLDEAIKTKKATLRETGTTNLQIENHSGEDIFVQSAVIVKGGQQDRMLANDLIIAPSTDPTSVPAYCVEHDRSTQRGNEPLAFFSEANELAPLAEMRVLAKKPLFERRGSAPSVGDGLTAPRDSSSANASSDDQQKLLSQLSWYENQSVFQESVPQKALQEAIWRNVSDIQTKLSAISGHSVTDSRSPSSLELSLEDSLILTTIGNSGALTERVLHKVGNAVGLVYSINGSLQGAEIYGQQALFLKELPSILKSVTIESRIEQSNVQRLLLSFEPVLSFLKEHTGDQFEQDISVREHLTSYSGGGHYRFETYDRLEPQTILHLSILTSTRN